VTSAELGALNAENLPVKRNVKGLNGLDALTGKSNFDIGEFILLRMLELFSGQRGTFLALTPIWMRSLQLLCSIASPSSNFSRLLSLRMPKDPTPNTF